MENDKSQSHQANRKECGTSVGKLEFIERERQRKILWRALEVLTTILAKQKEVQIRELVRLFRKGPSINP